MALRDELHLPAGMTMTLSTDIATACASTPLVARWAPQLAAAAEAHARPELGLTAEELALDLAAIVWRETRGRNVLGDGGHGHGLGQVDDRSHGDWLKAHADGMEPESNLLEAASIYVEGLLLLVSGQPRREPLAWTDLRRCAMAAYNTGVGRVLTCLRAGVDPDTRTTGGDYGRDTWRQREVYAAALAAARGEGGVCG